MSQNDSPPSSVNDRWTETPHPDRDLLLQQMMQAGHPIVPIVYVPRMLTRVSRRRQGLLIRIIRRLRRR